MWLARGQPHLRSYWSGLTRQYACAHWKWALHSHIKHPWADKLESITLTTACKLPEPHWYAKPIEHGRYCGLKLILVICQLNSSNTMQWFCFRDQHEHLRFWQYSTCCLQLRLQLLEGNVSSLYHNKNCSDNDLWLISRGDITINCDVRHKSRRLLESSLCRIRCDHFWGFLSVLVDRYRIWDLHERGLE
jgi:hypothetical protein